MDNGNTWANAINTGSNFSTWKYNWILPRENGVSHTIKCRANDRASNTENPSTGNAVNIDTLAPTLSNIRATSINYDSVNNVITNIIIQWETNEPSTSQVEYGETTSYGVLTSIDGTKVTNHSVAINGINLSDYNYKVRSKDAAGNETISSNYSPIILIGPGSEGEDTFIVDRALIIFDLSSLPNDATIINGRLKLFINGALTDGADLILEAHEVLKQWTESGATWNKYNGISSWDTPGGDYNVNVEGNVTIPWMGIKYIDITNISKEWLNGTKANNGLLLKAENESAFNHKSCNSFEYSGIEQKPKLKIIYTQP